MAPQDATGQDLLAIAGLIVMGGAIWFFGRDVLLMATAIMSATVSFPAYLLGETLAVWNWRLPVLTEGLLEPTRRAVGMFLRTPLRDLHLVAAEINQAGGRNGALIIAILAVRAAAAARRYRPDQVCRGRHSLDSMIAQQSRVWAPAQRAVELNPSTAEIVETGEAAQRAERQRDKLCGQAETAIATAAAQVRNTLISESGMTVPLTFDQVPETGSFLLPEQIVSHQPPPLGRAARPEEWLAFNGIGITTRRKPAADIRSQDRIVPTDECQAAIEIALAGQLTRQWNGARRLNRPHERALMACLGTFAAAARQQVPESTAETLIDGVSRLFADCAAAGQVEARLAENTPWSQQINAALEHHAELVDALATGYWWTETAILQIWLAGREGGGVLAPARFLWLKPEDRALWYAISASGSNPVVEAAGICAHHLAETQHGMALAAPRVQRAREALLDIYFDFGDRQRATTSPRQATSLSFPTVAGSRRTR